ncbi:putative 3-oxoacyl [Fusarium austroafricanum]|uniref:Putative 3-oxoacyl n=1 Tax=Fusarium austroafricanum TaxID=2364996 RepID=A0A8H4KLW5_9HYPO|nr:putative 3-oxoacyl [Fusarium austroafricanum]
MASRLPLSLAGKHCVVTGGTGSIGFRIAAAFADRGSVVTILSRNAPEKEGFLRPELKPFQPVPDAETFDGERRPEEHTFTRLDVSRPDIFKGLIPNLGPVDVLVNCAGVTQMTALKRTDPEEVQQILNVNLRAAILVSKYIKMNNHGCIINISSLLANKGGAGASVYAASKAGLVGFTRALALEYSPRRIRVNAILPGWIESPMWDQIGEGKKNIYIKDCPAGRVGTPDEVADAALFLATNRFANNCVLNLDGGYSAL